MKKKSTKNAVLNRSNLPKLTQAEEEVLALLSKEKLRRNQIATRRKCSKQAVSNIISNLKKKGALNIVNQDVYKSGSTSTPSKPNSIRFHGMEFNIKILFKDARYQKIIKKCNVIKIDGNTVRLFKDVIEIYSEQSFFGDNAQKSTIEGFRYFNRFVTKLEHDLKIILIKPRAQNIRMVNAHYAEINNGIARECGDKSQSIRVYGNDDGKLWFLIDNSFNLHEGETVHPQTSKHDMENVIQPFLNDLRDNKPPTLSEMMNIFNGMSEQIISLNKIVGALCVSQQVSVNTLEAFMKTSIEKPEFKEESLPKNWKNPLTG